MGVLKANTLRIRYANRARLLSLILKENGTRRTIPPLFRTVNLSDMLTGYQAYIIMAFILVSYSLIV
jgi:hypothetical protein